MNILYIHGFNSSPQSLKTELTKAFFKNNYPEVNFFSPQIKVTPNQAINQLITLIESKKDEPWCFIGSSLGGYFASYLAEKYSGNVVLINPAVRPYELLSDYLGEQIHPYTNEVYQVTSQYIDDLKQLEVKNISKKAYLVMVQTGDEVLDYQQAVEKYRDSHLIVQQGGDHSFINFESMLPEIAQFLM